MVWYFLALLGSNILSLIGVCLLKYANKHQHSLFSSYVIISVFLYGAGFILYFLSLKKFQLYVAQLFSAAFVLGGAVLMGWLLFGEKITYLGITGLLLILLGIVLINV